jgi:N-acetylglucosamine-6-phosphate deacetylase
MSSITLCNGKVLTQDGIRELDVAIEKGKIVGIGRDLKFGERIDCSGLFVLPGFRDQHIHDLPSLLSEPDTERIRKIAASLVRHGVTSAKLATIAMPPNKLLKYAEAVKQYMNSKSNGFDGARIEGLHIEGTFIRRECAGAQPREYIVEPWMPESRSLLDSLAETGVAKMVNIAADFGPDLIKYAVSKGFIVGCGHSKASARQMEDAWRHGLKYIVHITNGAMGQSFKPFDGGGTYEAALTLPLSIEIIVDGYHVDMRYVSDIIERRIQKGREHEIIAVTDAAFSINEEVPKEEFQAFSVVGYRKGNALFVKRFIDEDGKWKEPPPNTLFGSLLTMDKAFENLLNMFSVDHEGFMIDVKARDFSEAIRLSSIITSYNQACLEGLTNVGVVKKNSIADIVVLKIDGSPGKYSVKVIKTIVNGVLHEFA